jgi:hypothetical protein
MLRKLVLMVVLVSAATAAFMPAASATTQPSFIIDIRVTMSDSAVKLSRTQAYRGWGVNFIVRNVGKKPHKFQIGGLQTPALAPGGRFKLEVNLELRGKVVYRDQLNRGPRTRGVFRVV